MLGEHDLVLAPGEAAEFDTRVPHWFGAAGNEPVGAAQPVREAGGAGPPAGPAEGRPRARAVIALAEENLIHSRKWARLRHVPAASDFESMLRGAALRVTRPRVAVLSAVHNHPHADTESIIGVVRADLGEVSHQAVDDVLRALTAADLVRRIQPTGSVARYEARVGDNHHHVVCRSCGAIAMWTAPSARSPA